MLLIHSFNGYGKDTEAITLYNLYYNRQIQEKILLNFIFKIKFKLFHYSVIM